nr:T9SS type A sorting domain-containing protein [Saprospiraceae bacterium]
DASDQTSLSRIWGGIHPPADDIPGRLIGEVIGVDAFNYALPYFNLDVTDTEGAFAEKEDLLSLYPNPVAKAEGLQVQFQMQAENVVLEIHSALGQVLVQQNVATTFAGQRLQLDITGLSPGIYTLQTSTPGAGVSVQQFVVK